MTYAESWTALSNRIKNLCAAGHSLVLRDKEIYGAGDYLRGESVLTIEAITKFRKDFGGSLPISAIQQIDAFLQSRPVQALRDKATSTRGLHSGLVALEAFEGAVTFSLSGRQEVMLARSELALMHLQRLIAADPDVQGKWQRTYEEKREEECERLGAAHLLSHGIFAFKAESERGITDLIFPERQIELTQLQRSVAGCVLTEWKKVTQDNVCEKLDEAREQAEIYKGGVLAALELVGDRYLIAVSEKMLSLPVDFEQDGILYRHINVAVKPGSASVEAKSLARQRKASVCTKKLRVKRSPNESGS